MIQILRTEHEDAIESQEAIRNLVFLVSSLTTSGYHELRPMAFSTGSLFQLPNFSVPPPSGKGLLKSTNGPFKNESTMK